MSSVATAKAQKSCAKRKVPKEQTIFCLSQAFVGYIFFLVIVYCIFCLFDWTCNSRGNEGGGKEGGGTVVDVAGKWPENTHMSLHTFVGRFGPSFNLIYSECSKCIRWCFLFFYVFA